MSFFGLVLLFAAVYMMAKDRGYLDFLGSSAPLNTPAQSRVVNPRGDLSSSEKSVIELFEVSKQSVAYIFTESVENGFFQQRVAEGAGSGFIWDQEGHVVTNSSNSKKFLDALMASVSNKPGNRCAFSSVLGINESKNIRV